MPLLGRTAARRVREVLTTLTPGLTAYLVLAAVLMTAPPAASAAVDPLRVTEYFIASGSFSGTTYNVKVVESLDSTDLNAFDLLDVQVVVAAGIEYASNDIDFEVYAR